MKKANHEELAALRHRFLSAGLLLTAEHAETPSMVMPVPTAAGDRRRNVSTVKEMRSAKDW